MRKKNKFNPELLKEELNRFKLLENYNFYTGKQEVPEYHVPNPDDNIILGDLEELDEADEEPTNDELGNLASDLGVDAPKDEETPEEPADEEPAIEEPAIEEPAGDEVEVDVTSLVKGSEEAKVAADKASQNSEMLLQKLTDLEARIASMDAVTNKIAELEKEIIKRNPTPVEKLEMRSLSSYPYSQKLTDYWADKEGAYDVMDKEKEKKEYVLTQKDVDTSYSEPDIKQSFSVKDDEYTEEDI